MPQNRITLRERAHTTGNITAINGYRVNRDKLRQGLLAQGYDIQETPNFLICCRGLIHYTPLDISTAPPLDVLIVHWFAPSQIDANLGFYVMKELKPFGLLSSPEHFGNVFGAIVMSLSPQAPERAWRLYASNTLTRYHELINQPHTEQQTEHPIDVFATLYKRVCEIQTGASLLDAGCSFGFLPLVVAERIPGLRRVVGVDIETSPFATSRYIATKRKLSSVQFQRADLLTNDVERLGYFDTVTILHVLEHFTEEQVYTVLTHLLPVVRHRLIIGVPYEEDTPEEAYGHLQLFTEEKLAHVGQWCIRQLGYGSYRVEDCVGGLLVVDVSGS